MEWARVFSDETVGYVADFTTTLVNGGIIGTAIYAYVRRREFVQWLRKAYAALLALIAELRTANELARAKTTAPPPAPSPSTADAAKPAAEPVQQRPPQSTLSPPPPQLAAARPAPKQSKEPTAHHPMLAWGIGAAVVVFIVTVALLRACSAPAPVVVPPPNAQPPVVVPPRPLQPPPPAAPSPRERWGYTVRPNESCWLIAERAEPDPAKTGQLWADIVTLNPTLCSSDRHRVLRPGTVIMIPAAVYPAALARSCPWAWCRS